jgi:hypothetical protein
MLWVLPALFLLAFYFTPLIEIIQRSNLFQQGLGLSSSEWAVILKRSPRHWYQRF